MIHKEFVTLTEHEQYWVVKYIRIRLVSCIPGEYKYALISDCAFLYQSKGGSPIGQDHSPNLIQRHRQPGEIFEQVALPAFSAKLILGVYTRIKAS